MSGTARWNMIDGTAAVSDVRISHGEAVPEPDEILAALTRRCRDRGFIRAAQMHKNDMDAMEEEARAVAPAHYRWDELCANGRGDRFRSANYLGRQIMDVNDFAAYFEECRQTRRASESNACTNSAEREYVPARTREQSRMARMTGTSLVASYKEKENASSRVIALAKDWLCPDDPALRRAGKKQRLPMSAFSVFAIIAVSLMLIVSSSVMVAGAKREVSNLGDEVHALSQEAKLASDKLESSIDYLEIYRTATEEYGMIPASQVQSVYVDTTNGNSIEILDEEGDNAPTLTTLLAAIGIDFGS